MIKLNKDIEKAKKNLIRAYKEFGIYEQLHSYIRTDKFDEFVRKNLMRFLKDNHEALDYMTKYDENYKITKENEEELIKFEETLAKIAIPIIAPHIKNFLLEKQAYDSFCKNLEKAFKERGNSHINNIESYLLFLYSWGYSPYATIMYAFDWDDTKEGMDYWSNIHLEFKNYLENVEHEWNN